MGHAATIWEGSKMILSTTGALSVGWCAPSRPRGLLLSQPHPQELLYVCRIMKAWLFMAPGSATDPGFLRIGSVLIFLLMGRGGAIFASSTFPLQTFFIVFLRIFYLPVNCSKRREAGNFHSPHGKISLDPSCWVKMEMWNNLKASVKGDSTVYWDIST